jgi:hypothetical protein
MTSPLPRLDDLISRVRAQRPDGSPLDHLSEAVLISQQLGDLADHLIGHFVDQARRAGSSWTDIGRGMGVTKQAAQQRFVPRSSPDVPELGNWAQFTDRARNAVVGAQEQARATGHGQVRPGHLLLGLLPDTDSVATRVIAQQAEVDDVRRAVLDSLGSGGTTPGDQVPFSAEARKLLALALREALRLGHNYVGTEHVLLGLLHDESTLGAVLAAAGVTPDRSEELVRRALAEILRTRTM